MEAKPFQGPSDDLAVPVRRNEKTQLLSPIRQGHHQKPPMPEGADAGNSSLLQGSRDLGMNFLKFHRPAQDLDRPVGQGGPEPCHQFLAERFKHIVNDPNNKSPSTNHQIMTGTQSQ